jgi:hypothetical protein
MTYFKRYRCKHVLWGLIVFFSLTCLFNVSLIAQETHGEKEAKIDQAGSLGELKTYEKKALFIFPILHSKKVNTNLLQEHRKQYLIRLLHYMFVTDFKRINFYDVRSAESIDSFMQNAQSYLRRNVKQITTQRMQEDGKFKEAMVSGDELIKTTENAFALVPTIDSIERKVISGKKSNSYSYNIYLHFDIYSTKKKQKLKTLRINNKKNLFGILSIATSFRLENGDLKRLSKNERKDEESFRNAMGGLFGILKTKLKQMPQFKIMAALSRVGGSIFGFDLGTDTSIKIDHRYKTFVALENGKRKMTGFGKIRKVKEKYSEAQTLIGKPQEGDQVEEDPKLGINLVGSFGTAPIHINLGNELVTGSHSCLFLGVEYDMGPSLGWSEVYTSVNLRLGLPKFEEDAFSLYDSVTQIFFNFGMNKKFYFRRFALNLGGYIGIHSATLHYGNEKLSGSSVGFTLNSALEIMINPSFSLYGGVNLDLYSNPSKLKDENNYETEFSPGWEWNAKGVSLNMGAKVTF